MLAMQGWGHADDRVIQRQCSEKVCMSCALFTYGIEAHCHTCVGCALMEALLEQGQHSHTAAVIGSPCITLKLALPSRHEKAGCSFPTQPGSTHLIHRYEAGLSPSRRNSVLAQLFSSIHELTGALPVLWQEQ